MHLTFKFRHQIGHVPPDQRIFYVLIHSINLAAGLTVTGHQSELLCFYFYSSTLASRMNMRVRRPLRYYKWQPAQQIVAQREKLSRAVKRPAQKIFWREKLLK